MVGAAGVTRDPEAVVEIQVFLREQFLTLFADGKPVFCTDVSTGKRAGWTPVGNYTIISKAARHRSSTYGKYVTRSGRVVRGNVDSRRGNKPEGARFLGAPMPNFLRMTHNGIGIHAGELPGYPASKGCIRVGAGAADFLFSITRVGDIVRVLENSPEDCKKTNHRCERKTISN